MHTVFGKQAPIGAHISGDNAWITSKRFYIFTFIILVNGAFFALESKKRNYLDYDHGCNHGQPMPWLSWIVFGFLLPILTAAYLVLNRSRLNSACSAITIFFVFTGYAAFDESVAVVIASPVSFLVILTGRMTQGSAKSVREAVSVEFAAMLAKIMESYDYLQGSTYRMGMVKFIKDWNKKFSKKTTQVEPASANNDNDIDDSVDEEERYERIYNRKFLGDLLVMSGIYEIVSIFFVFFRNVYIPTNFGAAEDGGLGQNISAIPVSMAVYNLCIMVIVTLTLTLLSPKVSLPSYIIIYSHR